MSHDFYPGAKLRLKVLLDDGVLRPPAPSSAEPSVEGAESFPQELASDVLVIPDYDVVECVPNSASVELNPYRQADTAKFEIDFTMLPFDPRRIRAMTVEIFGGVFTPSEWAAANGPLDAPGLVLPDNPGALTAVTSSYGTATNLMFQGFADDTDLDLDDATQTISITARDLTGELLDAEVPPNVVRDIPSMLPLNMVIQLVLTGDGATDPALSRRFGVPGYRGMIVVNDVRDDAGNVIALPTIADIKPKSWVSSGGTAKRGRKRSPGNQQKQSYWDWISDVCTEAGFRVYVRQGTIPTSFPGASQPLLPAAEIVITNPRTYYRQSTTTGSVILTPPEVRHFVWGLNCRVRISQKLKKIKVPTVRVTSFDTAAGERVSRDYPPIPVSNRPAPSKRGDRQEIKVFTINAISGLTRANLERYLDGQARAIYEELGRGDTQVTIETRTLAALPANYESQERADLFAMRPSDPVFLLIPGQDIDQGLVAGAARTLTESVAERAQDLVELGYDTRSAAFLASVAEAPYLQQEFRTQQINWDWDLSTGWSCKVEAINYLDTRDSTAAIDQASGEVAPQ
jgi:hypothetical protein